MNPQSDDRQRVLDATDIVRLVGEHVALKPKGREYVCLCPFHDDRNPSCYVVPNKQIFHCFVCGAGGNAIDFVMKHHQLGFRETLELLAERAGVELTPWKGNRANAATHHDHGVSKQEVADAGAFALDFFRTLLRHETHGAPAREVIQRRGFTPEIVDAFEMGAAPDRWDGLVQVVESKKLDPAAFVAAGLLKKRETGGLYDAFRHRWVFPIRDQLGRVVAFGGRKLREEDEPKYLNSSETPIFDKSSTCYGLPQATARIRETRRAVVVEGYTDVIACHQAGETNVVATLGTALTVRHGRILRRLCDEVILVFDGDEAGQRAADRALAVFFAEPIDVRIAVLPGGVDPADLITAENGTEQWRAVIDGAIDALDYRFGRLSKKLATLTPTARIRAVEEDVASLRELGIERLSPMRRKHVVRRLAQLAGVDESAVHRAFASRPARTPQTPEHAGSTRRTEPEGPAEHLIGAIVAFSDVREMLTAEDEARLRIAGERAGGTLAALTALVLEGDAGRSTRLDMLDDPDDRAAGVAWSRYLEMVTEGDHERIKNFASGCLVSLARLVSLPRTEEPTLVSESDSDHVFERINHLRSRGGNPTALAPPGTTD